MLGEIVAGLIGKVFSFFGGSKIAIIVIGVLLASTAGAGYLLKKSYQDNGEQKALLQVSSDNLEVQKQTIEFERDQFKKLQQKLIERENAYLEINLELNDARKLLNEIPDESGCLDVDLGRDYWMSINPDSSTDTTMRTD